MQLSYDKDRTNVVLMLAWQSPARAAIVAQHNILYQLYSTVTNMLIEIFSALQTLRFML